MKKDIKFNPTFKFAGILLLILQFLIRAAILDVLSLLLFSAPQTRAKRKALLIQKHARLALNLLEIKIHSSFRLQIESGGLIVCNHLSYVDVLVIAAQTPVLFITSVETKTSGLEGWLCRMAGCIFVERRKITSLKSEAQEIDALLSERVPIVLFPEATSSSGNTVLPFRSSLYECAIRNRIPVHALCIQYPEPSSAIPYHGNMKLLPHLFNLCRTHGTVAQLDFIETLNSEEFGDRKQLAKKTRARIQAVYVPRTQ